MFARTEEPELTFMEKLKYFAIVHWKGLVCFLAPIIALPIILPPPVKSYQWCAYTLVVMALYWVTECIPLPVTSFLPLVIFPITGVNSTVETGMAYMNDSLMMFLGSLILATCVEQSGLHRRIAYLAVRKIGFTHYRLLCSMCLVTMFVSYWITNTAATSMMVPINFAVLRVFEEQKLLKIFETTNAGELVASDITTCYFCATTFSSTIGGIGTLVGTGTNLVMKGLIQKFYPKAPEYMTFPLFSAFTVPLTIVLQVTTILIFFVMYLGWLRPGSEASKYSFIPPEGVNAAKQVVEDDWKKLGKLSFWEFMVIILFGGAMVLFFCRSPKMFFGWGDFLEDKFKREEKFIRDSALATFIIFLMFLLPNNLLFFKNFSAKYHEELPKKPVSSVLIWQRMNETLPYGFMFLLGGGFALSDAAKKSGLNDQIGHYLANLKSLPNPAVLLLIVIVVVFVTNFASNVVVCNVFVPISMQLAKEINRNPVWYALTGGISASFCYMLPVGTPGNLVVQSAAKITTKQMIKAGTGPTICAILFIWLAVTFWAPVIWSDLITLPTWANGETKVETKPETKPEVKPQ